MIFLQLLSLKSPSPSQCGKPMSESSATFVGVDSSEQRCPPQCHRFDDIGEGSVVPMSPPNTDIEPRAGVAESPSDTSASLCNSHQGLQKGAGRGQRVVWNAISGAASSRMELKGQSRLGAMAGVAHAQDFGAVLSAAATALPAPSDVFLGAQSPMSI